ncbi:MAG: iron-sulfur cluster assembly scaffold protein [bacterium]|nr:iron-sulfur cluster assembly scaffold protein [bacterium]
MSKEDLETFRRIWELSKDSPYMAKMEKPDLAFTGNNAVCGDWIEIAFRMKGKKIVEARFLHKGCALSAVGASVFSEFAEGKTLEAVRKLTPQKQLELFGAPVSPARSKCVMLPLEIIKKNPSQTRSLKGEGEVKLRSYKINPSQTRS